MLPGEFLDQALAVQCFSGISLDVSCMAAHVSDGDCLSTGTSDCLGLGGVTIPCRAVATEGQLPHGSDRGCARPESVDSKKRVMQSLIARPVLCEDGEQPVDALGCPSDQFAAVVHCQREVSRIGFVQSTVSHAPQASAEEFVRHDITAPPSMRRI